MRTMDSGKAVRRFGELLDSLHTEGPVTITRYGRGVAVLTPTVADRAPTPGVTAGRTRQAAVDGILRRSRTKP